MPRNRLLICGLIISLFSSGVLMAQVDPCAAVLKEVRDTIETNSTSSVYKEISSATTMNVDQAQNELHNNTRGAGGSADIPIYNVIVGASGRWNTLSQDQRSQFLHKAVADYYQAHYHDGESVHQLASSIDPKVLSAWSDCIARVNSSDLEDAATCPDQNQVNISLAWIPKRGGLPATIKITAIFLTNLEPQKPALLEEKSQINQNRITQPYKRIDPTKMSVITVNTDIGGSFTIPIPASITIGDDPKLVAKFFLDANNSKNPVAASGRVFHGYILVIWKPFACPDFTNDRFADSYKVERFEQGKDTPEIFDVPPGQNEFRDDSALPEKIYTYKVLGYWKVTDAEMPNFGGAPGKGWIDNDGYVDKAYYQQLDLPTNRTEWPPASGECLPPPPSP